MKPIDLQQRAQIVARAAATGSRANTRNVTAFLAEAYRTTSCAPSIRMPAVRLLLREYLDGCAAVAANVPIVSRLGRVGVFLVKLRAARAQSLPDAAWQLDLLDWLWLQVTQLDNLLID